MLETILLEQCRLDPAKPVLAGVSGGPDSLCLLGILQEAGYRVIVAHFNHQLRPEADQEAASVSERARMLGLPFVSDCADVRGYAEEHVSLAGRGRPDAALPLPVCGSPEAGCAGRRRRSYCRRPGRDRPDALFARGRIVGLERDGISHHPAGLRSADPARPAAAFALASRYRILLPRRTIWSRTSTPPTPTQTYFRNRLRHALDPRTGKIQPALQRIPVAHRTSPAKRSCGFAGSVGICMERGRCREGGGLGGV